jgi:hypothetical protein
MLELMRDFAAIEVRPTNDGGVAAQPGSPDFIGPIPQPYGPPAPTAEVVDLPSIAAPIVVPQPAGAGNKWTPTQIAAIAQSIYGMTPQAQAFQLKMATLNAQGQQAMVNAAASKTKISTTVWVVGGIALLGILGLVAFSSFKKGK